MATPSLGTVCNMKTCSKCQETKTLSEFGKLSRSTDGLNGRCKLCHAAASRNHTLRHKERLREYYRIYQQKRRVANPEKCKKEQRKWARQARKDDPEKVNKRNRDWRCSLPVEKKREMAAIHRQNNRETIRRVARAWARRHPDRKNAATAHRRAAKLKATPSWANMAAIKAIYLKASRLGKEVDHIIPLRSPTVCGLHWEGNLQLLAPLENARKGNSYGAS